MEGYTLSVNFLKQAKQLKMASPEYKIYADLRAAGNAMRDSWAIAFQGYGFNWPKDTFERELNKLESLESVQKRIAEVQGKKEKNENSEELTAEELAKATSKEQILKDLVLAQRKAKYGSPEWLKIVASIADYNKIKQDEIDTENNVCHFYLPVNYPNRCEDCIIFKNGQATFQKKK
jgi:predicted Zn-dependent protease